MKIAENDRPKAWTNRILVLNAVHGPPGDDYFPSPTNNILQRLKKAVSNTPPCYYLLCSAVQGALVVLVNSWYPYRSSDAHRCPRTIQGI